MSILPNQNDVLYGKGTAINEHPGNKHYRFLVDSYKPKFLRTPRQHKRLVAAEIVEGIHNLGGRFLIEDTKGVSSSISNNVAGGSHNNHIHPRILSKAWVCVEDNKIIDKVMHRLREKNKSGSQHQQHAMRKTPDPHLPVAASTKATEADSEIIRSNEKLGQTSDSKKPLPLEALGEMESWSQIEIRTTTPDDIEEEKWGSSPEYDDSERLEFDLNQLQCDGADDEELSSFFQNFSSNCDEDNAIQYTFEGTMQEWISRSKSEHSTNLLGYIICALPIALKITSCLIEAEKDELNGDTNPIPLSSIKAANVLVRAKALDCIPHAQEFPWGDELNTTDIHGTEIIDYVSIMSCVGDDPNAGGAMSRLCTLGFVLYELFSGEAPPIEEGTLSSNVSNLLSLNSIDLDNNEAATHGPRKKTQRSADLNSKCLTRLKCMGTPHSVCALIGNLLGCIQGDTRCDDAYSSFTDVFSDLKLMLEEPSIYLENISVTPLPKLLISDKLYGREKEENLLKNSFQEHIGGSCRGAIISGKAGVGKSKLALQVQALTVKANGYFVSAKFDQNQDVYPLVTVGSLFDSLCNQLAGTISDAQVKLIDGELENALGLQAGRLLGVSPGIAKLMPSCLRLQHTSCTSASMSMQYLFSELLRVLSSHTEQITFFLDDLQWADPISLQLIGGLVSSNKEVFFTFAYRDDEVDENGPFNKWLSSISMLSLETIGLQNMSTEGVNHLISESLHLSPRITLPLSSVLHHKAGGGNPLFLIKLIESLRDEGYIYVELIYPKWSWEMDKIMELEISDDVVFLLVGEMKKLDDDLQLGLKIASCLGTSVKLSVLEILSRDTGQDLRDVLQRLSEKGFMNSINGTMFCWIHDKIQQAAYEMMEDQERRKKHMTFGLALCANALVTEHQDNELFFMSVHQINRAGPNIIPDPSQRVMVAALNLKAGRKSIELSDVNTAFHFFEHGTNFLGQDDHWVTDYALSLNLFDAICDTACTTNNASAVKYYSEQVLDHARCSDDKLTCMFTIAKSLGNQGLHKECVEAAYRLLVMLGEALLRPIGDTSLDADLDKMNNILENTPNEVFQEKEEAVVKRDIIKMRVYAMLGRTFHYLEHSLFSATTLRLIELTMNVGLCFVSPLAFAFYGQSLVSMGNYDLGIRLGRVALKLSDKKNLLRQKSNTISVVYPHIFWLSTPLQSHAEVHLTGCKAAQQSGDVVSFDVNYFYTLSTNYITGQCLSNVRKDARNHILKEIMHRKKNFVLENYCMLHLQVCALAKGLHILKSSHIDNVPGLQETLRSGQHNGIVAILNHTHWLVRAFLFRQLDDTNSNICLISDLLSQKKILLRPIHLFGFFFEGLVSFQLARRMKEDGATLWLAKGEYVLGKMEHWNKHCSWNFENKLLLLDAERASILGETDRAELLYTRSIQSAIEHKFVHEEAIASELAAMFYCERGHRAKSYSLFMHSVECYKKWGAFAVSGRLETTVQNMFGSDFTQLGATDDILLSLVSPRQMLSKRRNK